MSAVLSMHLANLYTMTLDGLAARMINRCITAQIFIGSAGNTSLKVNIFLVTEVVLFALFEWNSVINIMQDMRQQTSSFGLSAIKISTGSHHESESGVLNGTSNTQEFGSRLSTLLVP